MKSLEIINKYSEELDFDPIEMVSDFLDATQQGDALETYIKAEHARVLARPRCMVCNDRSTGRNKVVSVKIGDKQFNFHKDCKTEALYEIETELGW
jgi:hypothetical protein